MASTRITDYLGAGLASARPVSPPVAAGALAEYVATDTGVVSVWNGTAWATLGASSGTVTSVVAGAGLAGGTITTSGTISLNLASNNSWSAAQRGVPVVLTDAATIATDLNLGNNFAVTLGGNRTLANPTNGGAGQAGQIVITQDGTGSRTLAYGTHWKFPGGTAPSLSTAAGAVDVLSYYQWDSTHIAAFLGSAFA